VPYADPERVVADWLTANVFVDSGPDRVRVVRGEDLPGNIHLAQRVIRVVQIPSGPGDTLPTLDIADVELNWYARTRDRVRELADTTRAELRYRLPKTTHPGSGAFVKQVLMLGGPAEAPSESSAFHRRLATVRIWLHHNPLT
jgi:hypothetical protein